MPSLTNLLRAAEPYVAKMPTGLKSVGGMFGRMLGHEAAPVTEAVAPAIAKSFGATLGQNAATVGRATVDAVKSPAAIRNLWAPAAGGAAGYTAGTGAEKALGLDSGLLSTPGAALGAGGTLLRTNPNLWNQARYAAGLNPGDAYKPVASTLNMLMRPKYPVIEPAINKLLPNAGPWLASGARQLPLVGTAAGATFAGQSALRYIPDRVTDTARQEFNVGDKDVLDRIWWDTFKNQHKILEHMYGINILPTGRPDLVPEKDNTAIGNIHREAVPNVVIPDIKYGLTRVRQEYPNIMNAGDTIRSLATPAGAMQTYALRNFAPKQEPDLVGAVRKILRNQQENFATDPNLLKSPIGKVYSDILLQPDVLNNPWVQRRAGNIALGNTKPDNVFYNSDPETLKKDYGEVAQQLLGKHKLFSLKNRDWAFAAYDSPRPHIDYEPVGTVPNRNRLSDLAGMGLGAFALPQAGQHFRDSLGPNPTSRWAPALNAAANTEEGQNYRRKSISDLANNIR